MNNPNIELLEGDGAILRDPTKSPPAVLKLLSQIGSEKVTSIKLIRTPLSKATQFLLNIASFGQLQEKLKQANIDTLFHLSMLINDKYELEKNEVIKFRINPNAVKSDSQTLDIPIDKDVTIQELLNNTKTQMGSNYGSYNAKNNNCSVFLSNVLSSNTLNNSNSDTFINQKTNELFDIFPELTEKIVNLGTTAGAVVDRAIQGEGLTFSREAPVEPEELYAGKTMEELLSPMDPLDDELLQRREDILLAIKELDIEINRNIELRDARAYELTLNKKLRLIVWLQNNLMTRENNRWNESPEGRRENNAIINIPNRRERNPDTEQQEGEGKAQEKTYNFGLPYSKIKI